MPIFDHQPRQPATAPLQPRPSPSTPEPEPRSGFVAPGEYHYARSPLQRAAPPRRAGLPASLKRGVEALSGIAMDAVTVHYNSPSPDRVDALAHAQGSEIHLGPGQEAHLAHEAWHVAQQRQGRVSVTGRTAGAALNDSPHLEREAETMGARALYTVSPAVTPAATGQAIGGAGAPIQRVIRRPRSKLTFGVLTTPMIMSRLTFDKSMAMVDIMKSLHKQAKVYTWGEAVQKARTMLKAVGRKVTGRPFRLHNNVDLLNYAIATGAPTASLATYLAAHAGLFKAAFQELEFSQNDFGLVPTMSNAQVKTAVTDTMMAMPATLARTVSAFNELAVAQVKAHSVVGSAWKGNQFEHWVDKWVFPTYKKRLIFTKKGTMTKTRSSDGYDTTTSTLWDYKHYTGKAPQDQAEDYHTILSKGYKSIPGGQKPKYVSYLFSSQAAATANKSLKTIYGFSVWYVTTGSPPAAVKLY